MGKSTAYFLSDAHLGHNLPYDPMREERLLNLLSTIAGEAQYLFIVGDLFDFWIEYRDAIRPDYFRVLHALKRLVDQGTNVHYLAGNHDFALGTFLSDTIGVSIHMGAFETELQGKKVFIHHGDGLLKTDAAYRIIRWILRNRVNQELYKLLHPSWGIGLATFFSKMSRNSHDPDTILKRAHDYRDKAKSIIDRGYEWVFLGHTHMPEITRWENGGYCNTGDWLTHNTFAEMRDGEVRLWRYQENGRHLPIEPNELPLSKK
jgi:UDP-2,3-diacylglucosamine hydrolase